METYLRGREGFPADDVNRREYQSGNNSDFTNRYRLSAPMFLHHKEGTKKPRTPSHLHRWVLEADRRSRRYRANPARPGVFSWERGRFRDICKCKPNALKPGDVVWFTFTVTFIIGKEWWPEFSPVELVRVYSAVDTGDPLSSSRDEIPIIPRPTIGPSLRDGDVLDGTSSPLFVCVVTLIWITSRSKQSKGRRRADRY